MSRSLLPDRGLLARQARQAFGLAPAQADHWAALRVGLSVAVPALALLVSGHAALVVYVVFGAFTGMYGRNEPRLLRLQHQALAALLLTIGVALGVGLSATGASPVELVVVEGLFAGLGSFHSDRFGLTPAGPFFGIFALGACASLPLAVAPTTAVLLCAGSAVFSLAVGCAGWLRYRRRDPARPLAVRRASPLPRAATYAVAAWVAGGVTVSLGIGHPHWAMAAAIVPLSAVGLTHRLTRGFHRILGTYGGLVVTGVILVLASSWLHGPWVTIVCVLLVVAFQFPTELFMTRNYGLALVFFTPLILLMTQLAHPLPTGELLFDRALETTLGAVVGMALAALSPVLSRVLSRARPGRGHESL